MNIWTLRTNTAHKTAVHTLEAATGSTAFDMGIARRSGQARLFETRFYPRENHESYRFFYMDGTTEEHSGAADPGDSAGIISPCEELAMNWETENWFYGQGTQWFAEKQGDVSGDLNRRAAQGESGSAGNNTYTVKGYEYDGSAYTLTFETSSVEKKTLLVGDDSAEGGEPKPVYATVVSVRPGSTIRATGGTTIALDWHSGSEELGVFAQGGFVEGNDCFMTGQIAASILNGPAGKTFRRGNEIYKLEAADSDGTPVYVRLGEQTAAVHGFTDVKATAYYADAVKWAVDRGVAEGTTATTFSPNNTCTTAQILTFLWRAKGSPAPAGHSAAVPSGKYYTDAANWALEKGLTDAFRADTPATRAATVTYLWKLAGKPRAAAAPFADVDAGAAYAQAVAWAVRQGITDGTSATTFSPDKTCTRGQIVTFLYRDLA
ncbi:MAG: S-layer homology domain-containing protein [Agathobaculum sp.]|uniref:S-layer homology domain-containing protein n=1 Tax=Agathobaculum sp. TaxID=2048138 RepID=UPI003D8AE48F